MLKNLKTNKLLWLTNAFLALSAAVMGVSNPEMYRGLTSDELISGVFSQDVITILGSIIIIFLAWRMKEGETKAPIVIIGILGYMFYAYGIYVIERFYSLWYLLYMTILAMTFYTMIYSLISIHLEVLDRVQVPKTIRNISVGFSLFIPVLFYPLWISHLIPLLSVGEKIEFTYSIYILDMVFVLPLFVIISVMALKNQGFGLVMIPTLFIKGFTLLFSVALGILFKPLFNQTGNLGEMLMYLSISIVFLILTGVYFKKLSYSS